MSDNKKPEVQTKALIVNIPTVGYLIRTEDGNRIAITPGLAVDLANQILATESGNAMPVPSSRTQFVQ
jgi:hypothetical protein